MSSSSSEESEAESVTSEGRAIQRRRRKKKAAKKREKKERKKQNKRDERRHQRREHWVEVDSKRFRRHARPFVVRARDCEEERVMESYGASCVCSRRWGEEWAPRPADRGLKDFERSMARCVCSRRWGAGWGAAPRSAPRPLSCWDGLRRCLAVGLKDVLVVPALKRMHHRDAVHGGARGVWLATIPRLLRRPLPSSAAGGRAAPPFVARAWRGTSLLIHGQKSGDSDDPWFRIQCVLARTSVNPIRRAISGCRVARSRPQTASARAPRPRTACRGRRGPRGTP